MDFERIRNWARAEGIQVGERGRLPKEVIDRYYAARTWETDPRGKVEEVAEFPDDFSVCQTCGVTTSVGLDGLCWVCRPVADPAVPETPEVPSSALPPSDAASDLAAALQRAMAGIVTAPELDETRVRDIALDVATEVLDAAINLPRVIEVHRADMPAITIDAHTHAQFETVVKVIGAGLNAYLVGPPGTGKTTLCGQVAEALGIPFAFISCDPTMPASKLFGFVDAGGNYRPTVFRDVFENGGLFLFDEMDNAHPGIVASMNTALANGHCAFPDGMVKKGVNARFAAAANTHGLGATRQFVGRNQLDAATLDRFVEVEIGIDEGLEESLTMAALTDNQALAREWLAKVREWRGNAARANLQVIISPRSAIDGAKLLGQGFDMATVANMRVFKGMEAGTRAKVEGK